MAKLSKRIWDYVQQPKTGAGLLYVALALGVARLWLLEIHAALAAGAEFPEAVRETFNLSAGHGLFFSWTAVSFALSCWLAYVLLRWRLSNRGMQRMLVISVVHALGAVRFYDWGLLLLAIMPLFALVPAVLFPQSSSRR